jgi:ribonuclease P/MRP protein subunit RPP1
MAERAKDFGYEVLAFSDYLLNLRDIEGLKRAVSEASKKLGCEIYAGVRIKALNKVELIRKVKFFRNFVHVVVVEGGNLEVNRGACSMPEVDILAHPENGRDDSGFDHVMASLARENHTALGIDFSKILEADSRSRISLLRKIRKNLRICEHCRAPVIFSTGAMNVWEIRGPREIMSLIQALGFDYDFAEKALLQNPNFVIQRANEVFSKEFVAPGVKRYES